MLSVNDIMEKSKEIIDKLHYCPIILNKNNKKSNKGCEGLYLEKLLGIKPSSKCLDLCDGEVKSFPITLKNGTFEPKETIAITMLNRKDLPIQTFEESRCHKKIQRIIFFPYLRNDDDNITFMKPIFIDMAENNHLYELLKLDYNSIRSEFLEKGEIQSGTGKYIQPRTKGPGKVKEGNPTPLAFYFKKEFINEFVLCK